MDASCLTNWMKGSVCRHIFGVFVEPGRVVPRPGHERTALSHTEKLITFHYASLL